LLLKFHPIGCEHTNSAVTSSHVVVVVMRTTFPEGHLDLDFGWGEGERMTWSSSTTPHSFAFAPVVIHLLRLYFVLETVPTAGFIWFIRYLGLSTSLATTESLALLQFWWLKAVILCELVLQIHKRTLAASDQRYNTRLNRHTKSTSSIRRTQ
jgi:hypothetical protein